MHNFKKNYQFFYVGLLLLSQSASAEVAAVEAQAGLAALQNVKTTINNGTLKAVLNRTVESRSEAIELVAADQRSWLEKYVLAVRNAAPTLEQLILEANNFTLNGNKLVTSKDDVSQISSNFAKFNGLGSQLFMKLPAAVGSDAPGRVNDITDFEVSAATQATVTEADFISRVNAILVNQTEGTITALKQVCSEAATASDPWINAAKSFFGNELSNLVGYFGQFNRIGLKIINEINSIKNPTVSTGNTTAIATQAISSSAAAAVQASRSATARSQNRVAAPAQTRGTSVVSTPAATNNTARTRATPVASRGGRR